MILRELEEKDAVFMLEWMHDENVSSYLEKDFQHMTIDHCKKFIQQSHVDSQNRHYAVVDDSDEYMGTISLKNIDTENRRAEYAISCRTKAMGKGFARRATQELFEVAKNMFHLKLLYLNVYQHNIRAQKMYQKVGFEEIKQPDFIQDAEDSRLLWFQKKL